jgi:hypothetical protein
MLNAVPSPCRSTFYRNYLNRIKQRCHFRLESSLSRRVIESRKFEISKVGRHLI